MSNTAKIIIILLVALIVVGTVGAVLMIGLLSGNPQGQQGGTVAQKSGEEAKPDEGAPTRTMEKGDTLARIQARGELVVGMDTGTPPWVGSPPMYFPNAEGQPDGFDYLLATKVAAAVGVPKVKLVHHLYSEFEGALTGGTEVDVIIGGFTPYDAPGIAWSDPYLEYGLCLVVPAKSPVQTTADLTGRTIGIYDDEAAEEEVNRLVKGYKGMVKLEAGYWDQLASGQLDAFLYDYPFTVAEIKTWYEQNPHRVGSLRIAQYNLTDSTYAVAVRKDDTALLEKVNLAIKEWRGADEYRAAVRKYLKNDQLPVAAPVAGYSVKQGDTLGSIAQATLGDRTRWPEIWTLNKSRYPNPDLIEIGDTLTLPGNVGAR